jgi:hypothetical protein
MRPIRMLTADQLLNRRAGSNVNASTADADLLAQDSLELDNMITHSEETGDGHESGHRLRRPVGPEHRHRREV